MESVVVAHEDLTLFVHTLSSQMSRFLQFDHVSFAYPGMINPLLADVSALFPEGCGTGNKLITMP